MPKKLISQNLLGYYPAQLNRNKCGWTISYYVENPVTKELCRKQVRVNRIKSQKERLLYARKMVIELNKKLHKGWNPFLEEAAPKGFALMKDALDSFLKNKKKELRPDSMRTYNSYCSMLLEYIRKTKCDKYAVSFTEAKAKDYMMWVYNEKNVSATTYNNYLLTYRVIFNWLIDNKYASVNPFQKIKRKKPQKKIRRILDYKERTDLRLHYEVDNPRFLVVCLLAYHCLMRPTEITFLKPEHFNLKKGYIITSAHTKNGNVRIISIPIYMVELLKALEMDKQDPKTFCFSSGFRPGHHKLCPRKISKEWDSARKLFGWGKDLQFYSLRDSGIVQMLRDGIPIEEVQKHADHQSITTTQKYITLAFPEGVESVKNKSSKF